MTQVKFPMMLDKERAKYVTREVVYEQTIKDLRQQLETERMSVMHDMLESEYKLKQEIKSLRQQLETERMRLAACGVVALSNTPESAAKARNMLPDYRSASCDDVARAVDREMELRQQLSDSQKRVVVLRNALVKCSAQLTRLGYSANHADEALTTILNLQDVILCWAESVGVIEFGGYWPNWNNPLKPPDGTKLYRAWELQK